MDELRKQFDYYIQHQDSLVEKYAGKYVVITGEAVAADFDQEIEAYEFATGSYAPGTFLIQLVAPGQDNYSQTFRSRVAI